MNKRHYEHTLPNIRGSLSNTYCLPMFGRINTVQSVCQHAYGLEMILQGGAVRMDINAISQPAHYQGVWAQHRQVGKETGADILSVGGGMTGSYHIDDMHGK